MTIKPELFNTHIAFNNLKKTVAEVDLNELDISEKCILKHDIEKFILELREMDEILKKDDTP